jgi:hypothetical protein
MYIAVTTCPGIAHVTGVLSQFNSCYIEEHWNYAKHVLRYLKGCVFKLADGDISWKSKKEHTVALFLTEAECMGLSAACKEAIYLQRLFCEMFGIEEKVVIHNDNQCALKL